MTTLVRIGRNWRLLAFVATFIALIISANSISNWILSELSSFLTPSTEPALHRLIILSAALYIVLMAIPFLPGVEIGLGLMVILGPKIIPLVYGCTLVSLSLSFVLGRLLPPRYASHVLSRLNLRRAAEFTNTLNGLRQEDRLPFLLANCPTKLLPLVLRYRFLALALLLNLPGNAAIGGGGGIGFTAGFSRIFPFPLYLLTIALAVAPVPLLLWLQG